MRKTISIVLTYLGVVIVSVFPLMFLWLNNIIQISDTNSVLKISVLLALAAAIILLMLYFFAYKRNLFAAGLAVMTTMLIFENEAYIESFIKLLFPDARYWHGVTVAALLIISFLFLFRYVSSATGKTLVKIFSLVFVGLILFNLVMAIPAITTTIKASKGNIELTSSSESADGPNVYWLLFDDYAPNVTMEEYWNYDNSAFTDWLEEQGFSISYTSRNESENTAIITCNVANLGYVSSYSNDRTLIEDFNLVLEQRKNSKLIQTISDNCYSIIGIGNADFYGYTGETIGNIETGRTLNGDTVETLFLNKTAIYPFVTPSNNSETALMLTQLEYLQHSENIPVGGTFVIAHFTCPHTPHLFFADGTTATSTNPSNYLEHFIFATTQMKKIIATILENDPSAKIALVSDHGNKGGCEEYTEKVRCFAALYNGNGEKIDIEGYSGINIMTVLLNQTFGTDYPFVPYVMQEEVLSH